MANDPAFLFYPGDYLRDTQCLSEKSQVAYDRIMCEHMRNICITQDQLNFFTKRLNEDEKNELLFVLNKIKGGYQISWVSESIYKRRSYSESRAKNRQSKNKKDMKTYVQHMENEIEIENVNDIIEEARIFTIEECLAISLKDDRWVKANKTNQRELGEFNKLMEKRGIYVRNALDYKNHFSNWKKNEFKNPVLSIESAKIARDIENEKNEKILNG